MTAQRQPNPLWVDRALRQHWAAIESRVGKRWMPVPSTTPPKKAPTLSHAKRARAFYEWGTGRYGTVLPTRDPKIVVKITSDKSEIEFILRAEQLHHWPDGLVHYYRLVQLGRDGRRQVYAVWREAAYAVGLVIHDAEYAVRKLKISPATFRKGVDLLDNFYKAARAVQQAISHRTRAPKNWEALLDISQELSTTPGFSAIGQGLSFYLDHGIVLADVHANNIGLVNRRNKAVMVITDPGHAIFVEQRTSQRAANSGSWRDMSDVVYGRRVRLGDVKGGRLYHGSPVLLEEGTILKPGHGKRFRQSSKKAVSITSDVGRARHWGGKDSYVYEVEPIGDLELWRAGPEDMGTTFVIWEARVPQARVLRRVP